MNYGDLKKIWIIFMQNRRKRLTTVFFINVSSDIKRCIQFTVKIKMKTFNRIPASCFSRVFSKLHHIGDPQCTW